LCSHSVVPSILWNPEGSLPSSQELSTCTYPEPDQSSPQHSILCLEGPYMHHDKGRDARGRQRTNDGITIRHFPQAVSYHMPRMTLSHECRETLDPSAFQPLLTYTHTFPPDSNAGRAVAQAVHLRPPSFCLTFCPVVVIASILVTDARNTWPSRSLAGLPCTVKCQVM
jgi:hypothetical protein